VPAALTEGVARELYGLESDDLVGAARRPDFAPAQPGFALASH
jgi:hypothetical protein